MLATEKIVFEQSNYLWCPQSLADTMVPLCKICFQSSEFNLSSFSKATYISSLHCLTQCRKSFSELGFEIINTPYSGVCAWEAVALNITKNFTDSIQHIEQHYLNKGVTELVRLNRLDKQSIIKDAKKTNLSKVLTTCKYKCHQ